MAVLGAPVFPHGNLAFFVAIFSEMTRLSAGVGLRLHSIHPSITRESKWRYIMKKINLRELYPDVYTTDFFVIGIPLDATKSEIAKTFSDTGFSRLPVYDDDIDHIVGIVYQKDFHNHIYHTNKPLSSIKSQQMNLMACLSPL